MFVYLVILNMGFVLFGLFVGIVKGDVVVLVNVYSLVMFYVIVYLIMMFGLFGVVMLFVCCDFEVEMIDDFKGFNKCSLVFVFVMMVMMFLLVGILLIVGFYVKLVVFEVIVNVGFMWLVVLVVIMLLFGVFYYLCIVKLMYFDVL